jgi:hypothetical protein
LRKKLERNDNADERAWPLACAALLISAEGQQRTFDHLLITASGQFAADHGRSPVI